MRKKTNLEVGKRQMFLTVFLAIVFLAISGFSGCNVAHQSAKASSPVQVYTLNVNINPEGSGEVSLIIDGKEKLPSIVKEELVVAGTPITLLAKSKKGYVFDRWNGDIIAWSSEIAFTMDADKTIAVYFKPTDPTPPAISMINIEKVTDCSAVVAWVTDDSASGLIEYGTTPECDNRCLFDERLTIEHKFRMTKLEPGTTYYFRVKSKNESGGESASSEQAFRTSYPIPVGCEVGNRVPDFTLPSYNDDNPNSPNKGQVVKLSDFQGKKILINFWSTYCGACIGEFPLIREIYFNENCKQNSGDWIIITVDIDGRADRIKALEEKFYSEVGDYAFPILLDNQEKENAVYELYGIWATPTTFFVDSDGIIREIEIGRFQSVEEIEEIFSHLD